MAWVSISAMISATTGSDSSASAWRSSAAYACAATATGRRGWRLGGVPFRPSRNAANPVSRIGSAEAPKARGCDGAGTDARATGFRRTAAGAGPTAAA